MTKYLIPFVLLLFLSQIGEAQSQLPILKANNAELSIRDGKDLKEGFWTVSSSIDLDVYTADKTRETKRVTYLSDIDSISFEIRPLGVYDFDVVLNGRDTCHQRVESGITFQPDEGTPYVSDTIPFAFTKYNNISIEAVLNGMDTLNLMFHTAAGEISLTKDATQNLKSLRLDKSIEGASGWGGSGAMRVSTGNSLEIGDLKWEGRTIFEDEHSGHFTDGKFGPELFQNKVVEVDFENKRLIVHSRPPEMGKGFEMYDLRFKGIYMFLEGQLDVGDGKMLKNDLLIHSGYSGTILLDDEFANRNALGEQLEMISERELKDSFGNTVKTRKAVLPFLTIGTCSFPSLPIGFFEGAIGRQQMSVIGGDLLKRFHLILDLQSAVIYMKPNALMGLTYSDI